MTNKTILKSKGYKLFIKYFREDFWNLSKKEFDDSYKALLNEKDNENIVISSDITIKINNNYHINIWKHQSIEFRSSDKEKMIKTYGINGFNTTFNSTKIFYFFIEQECFRLNYTELKSILKKSRYIRKNKLKNILKT